MIAAIDGAVKRLGAPECISCGVAWIITEDGEMFYRAHSETQSTSQRGELYGLLSVLQYAAQQTGNEDIIIITDSEYLYNTITKQWYVSWMNNDWIGSSGHLVKNDDLWKKIVELYEKLNAETERVYMQWTKGHLVYIGKAAISTSMTTDNKGYELYDRITSLANRPVDKERIIKEFKLNRARKGEQNPDDETCLFWAKMNAMADALATHLVQLADHLM